MDFEVFVDKLLDVLIQFAIILIPILFGVLTRSAVNYLRAYENKLAKQDKRTEQYVLQDVARTAIFAAEQLFLKNNDKAIYAKSELIRVANQLCIPIDGKDAQLLIEGTLKMVKAELREYSDGINTDS